MKRKPNDVAGVLFLVFWLLVLLALDYVKDMLL